jgi:uncharacterized membrane-anchored protein
MKSVGAIYQNFPARFVIFTAFLLLFFSRPGLSQPPETNWVEGPKTVDLGENIAMIELGQDYLFADAKDTRKLMASVGNPPTNHEVGLIIPKNREAGWFIVFEYRPVGYVRDTEKDAIDSDAILKSIKGGTERANKVREEKGFAPLNVLGWYEKPHYDTQSHNLVWALLAESKEGKVVNYNVRLLGRHGFMSTVLVTDPSTLAACKPEVDTIIKNFSYKSGKSYAEFVKGDKVAQYGLTALIAGGAGAAAVKLGFFKILAKFWKIVAVAVIGFLGVLWRIIKAILGRGDSPISMKTFPQVESAKFKSRSRQGGRT